MPTLCHGGIVNTSFTTSEEGKLQWGLMRDRGGGLVYRIYSVFIKKNFCAHKKEQICVQVKIMTKKGVINLSVFMYRLWGPNPPLPPVLLMMTRWTHPIGRREPSTWWVTSWIPPNVLDSIYCVCGFDFWVKNKISYGFEKQKYNIKAWIQSAFMNYWTSFSKTRL